MTTEAPIDPIIEQAARAMMAVDKPHLAPDATMPGYRGADHTGFPIWLLYVSMAKAAQKVFAE